MTELFSALAAGWPDDAPTQRLRMVAIGLAMEYETWRSLTDKGCATQKRAISCCGSSARWGVAPSRQTRAQAAGRDEFGVLSRGLAGQHPGLLPSSS